MSLPSGQVKRRYWVVSPNVRNNELTVPDWRAASVVEHAAFMGYGPNDQGHSGSGYKFAHEVKPGDVVIIARRHGKVPELVGVGVVRGKFQAPSKGNLPAKPGSLRKLSPFLPRSGAVPGVPLLAAPTHTKALAELHPTRNPAQKKVCAWIEKELKLISELRKGTTKSSTSKKGKKAAVSKGVRIGGPPGSFQEDYTVRTTERVKTAQKKEAKLVRRYVTWIKRQGRSISTVLYGKLSCDAYEIARRNLIEAKSSTSREHLRKAVGQLSDYAYRGKEKLGAPNQAILVPAKPSPDSIIWLTSLEIGVVWPKKTEFLDSANGQFT